MTTTSPLSIKECISFGWNAFKARPWFFVGTFVIYAAIQIALSIAQKGLPGFFSFLLSLIVSTFLYIGLFQIYLKAHDDVMAPSYADFWNPKAFWRYLGTSLLLGIIVIVGLVLVIVPGVILALALGFGVYLVIDKGMNPVAALKESARITKGNRWKLFLLELSLIVLVLLGMIPLFLGLLIAGPLSMLASVHAYRVLESAANAITPAA